MEARRRDNDRLSAQSTDGSYLVFESMWRKDARTTMATTVVPGRADIQTDGRAGGPCSDSIRCLNYSERGSRHRRRRRRTVENERRTFFFLVYKNYTDCRMSTRLCYVPFLLTAIWFEFDLTNVDYDFHSCRPHRIFENILVELSIIVSYRIGEMDAGSLPQQTQQYDPT